MTPEAHSLFAPTPPQTAPKSLPGQLEAGMYDEKLDGFFGWRRRANERRPGVSNDRSTKRAPPGGLERDTIEPPFDPATYARESERMLPVEVASGTGLAAPRTPSFAESDEDVPTRRRHPSSAGHPSEMRVAQASRPMLEAGPESRPLRHRLARRHRVVRSRRRVPDDPRGRRRHVAARRRAPSRASPRRHHAPLGAESHGHRAVSPVASASLAHALRAPRRRRRAPREHAAGLRAGALGRRDGDRDRLPPDQGRPRGAVARPDGRAHGRRPARHPRGHARGGSRMGRRARLHRCPRRATVRRQRLRHPHARGGAPRAPRRALQCRREGASAGDDRSPPRRRAPRGRLRSHAPHQLRRRDAAAESGAPDTRGPPGSRGAKCSCSCLALSASFWLRAPSAAALPSSLTGRSAWTSARPRSSRDATRSAWRSTTGR